MTKWFGINQFQRIGLVRGGFSSSASKAIFQAEEGLGDDMFVDETMQTLEVTSLGLDFDIDKNYEMHYTPKILSNAGLHNSAKKLKTIIDLNAEDDNS